METWILTTRYYGPPTPSKVNNVKITNYHWQTLAGSIMWCLFALVEEKGVLPVYLPFFSNLDARQAFPWPDPRTLPSPLPQEMELCRLVFGWGPGLCRESGLRFFFVSLGIIHSR